MSGIFGFTYRVADKSTVDDAIGGLQFWNRIYGAADGGTKIIGGTGFGCCVEHFSDKFPYGGPILSFGGAPAVVDALLYNRDELLSLLEMDSDSSISDEDLLLKLIEKKGYSSLRLVNGDFAGAIFDEKRQEWTLFRDHMGVRTLYYYMDDDKIVFSTDLRGMLSVPGVNSHVNEQLLFKKILGNNYLSMTETEYQHIRCVHPGSVTYLRLDRKHCRFRQKLYWRLRERKIRLHSDEEYRRKLRELVTDAVHRRCDAISGLLGAELSGGLDSSVIDILINRHGREAVYYSWCNPPEAFPLAEGADERRVILDVCKQENITCHFKEITETIYFIDEIAERMPSFINTPSLASGSKWIKKQGANVVFSGHGGDEGVSHRANCFELLYNLELWSYFKIHWNRMKGKKLRFLRAIWSGFLDAKFYACNYFQRPTKDDLTFDIFTKKYNQRMIRAYKFRPLAFHYAPYKYVRQGGSRNRLDNGAFLGAYSGVRYLFPYIDYRVMDFAVSIPRRLHVNHETSRLIFRETFADIMPKSLREVQYKDWPSRRKVDRIESRNQSFHENVDFLLKNLDESFWNEIFDFDGLRALHQYDVKTEEDIGVYNLLLLKLRRCILIQNNQKDASRWREFNADSV